MDRDTFLAQDYQLKVEYTRDQFGRMWNRFSFLLSFDTALGGLILVRGFEGIRTSVEVSVAVIGVLISAFWYAVAAQDRYLVELYRAQALQVYAELARKYDLSFPAAGDVRSKQLENSFLRDLVTVDALQWRIGAISTTRLAVLFPLISLVAWLLFIVGLAQGRVPAH